MQVITTHSGADFDALASLAAASKIYPKALIFLPGSPEKKVREYIDEEGLPVKINSYKSISREKIELLVIVDTRFRNRLGRLPELIEEETEIHIYDHHPRTEDDMKGKIDIRKKYGATSTILVHEIIKKNLPLTSREATLIATGIYEDTGCLTYPLTTPEDLEAVSYLLKEGADLKKVSQYVIQALNEKQVKLLNMLLESKTVMESPSGKIVFMEARINEYIEDLSVVVHKAMDILNPHALFAFISIGAKTICISRSASREINVGEILALFGGGGHPTAASVSLSQSPEEIKKKVKNVILSETRTFKKTLNVVKHAARIIPVSRTVEEAYHTLNHLNLEYAPVGDEKGRLYGVVERSEAEKAVRHGLNAHPVTEFISEQVPSVNAGLSPDEYARILSSSGYNFLLLKQDGKIVGVVDNKKEEGTADIHTVSKESIDSKLKKYSDRQLKKILKAVGETADMMDLRAYCVGGMVRDILMGFRHKDVDIVVEKEGIKFAYRLGEKLKGRVSAHKKFNTAVIKLPDREIDVATLRKEYYEFPGALPDVSEGTLKQDLARRDFTVNAMAVQVSPSSEYGKLIDYFGGRNDIKNKKIKILYPLSFIEDPTRIFRAARFEKRFGFKITADTLDRIKSAVKMDIQNEVSSDRIKEELLLIFNENAPHEILLRLDELGAMKFINEDVKLTEGVYNKIRNFIENKNLISPELIKLADKFRVFILVSILFSELPLSAGKDLLSRFHFPARFINCFSAALTKYNETAALLNRDLKPSEIFKLLNSFDDRVVLYIYFFTCKDSIREKIETYFEKLKKVTVSVNGETLKKMGYEPGPEFSKIINSVKYEKINGKIKTPEEEKEFIKSHY